MKTYSLVTFRFFSWMRSLAFFLTFNFGAEEVVEVVAVAALKRKCSVWSKES